VFEVDEDSRRTKIRGGRKFKRRKFEEEYPFSRMRVRGEFE
jgi:hypothetical protein